MPMMRRGPLAQYSVEWVLRQAGATHASGNLEFHTTRPVTLSLRGGQVCDGAEGVPADGLSVEDDHLDEAAARERVTQLLARILGSTDGWYYLDPLGTYDDAGPWRWETASLIMDARIRAHVQTRPPAEPAASGVLAPPRPAPAPTPAPAAGPRATTALSPASASPPVLDRSIELRTHDDDRSIVLGADAWQVVCALATTRSAAALHEALGWPTARLEGALADLGSAGVLDRAPDPAPRVIHGQRRSEAAVGTPAPTTAALALSVAPRTPGPSREVDDRRGALRRLISVLKPA